MCTTIECRVSKTLNVHHYRVNSQQNLNLRDIWMPDCQIEQTLLRLLIYILEWWLLWREARREIFCSILLRTEATLGYQR